MERENVQDELERRAFDAGLEVRAGEDGAPVIAGHAAIFNKLSVMLWGFREKIAPGAFADSLEDDVRALWQHLTHEVLGRTKADTLRLWEDSKGLVFENDPPDTQTGRDAVTLIKRRDVDQMSFGFYVLPGDDEWEEDENGLLIRTINKAQLIEVSPVTWAAYPDTEVGLRAMYGAKPEIPAGLRGQGALPSQGAGGGSTDETRARGVWRRRLLELNS